MLVRRALTLAALLAILPLMACDVTLSRFTVPPVAEADQNFEIVIEGTTANGTPAEFCGAVLQLPPGFALLDAWAVDSQSTFVASAINAPGFTALYTAEPGMTLTSVSNVGFSPSSPFRARLRLRAPAAPGNYTLKVALAATQAAVLTPQIPAGITNFAQIAPGANTANIQIVAGGDPGGPDWADNGIGLPSLGGGVWDACAHGDVNNDGLDDVIYGRSDTGAVRCFISGPAGFVESSAGLGGLVNNGGRFDIAFGDFDGNGQEDIVLGTGQIFLGDGGQTWTQIARLPVPLFSTEGVAVADVNNDGLDDIAIGSRVDTILSFFLATGGGSFVSASTGLPTGGTNTGGHGILIRDLNNDNNVDLVWAILGGIVIFEGDGAGTWSVGLSIVEPFEFYDVDASDIDGDGDQDLIATIASTTIAGPALSGGLRLYRQTPFLAPRWTNSPLGFPTNSDRYSGVVVSDVNDDGAVDVVASRRTNSQIQVFEGDRFGTFTLSTGQIALGLPTELFGDALSVSVGDIDGDGLPDIATGSNSQGPWSFRNSTDSRLGTCGVGTVSANAGGPFDVLTINGSAGLPLRQVRVAPGAPITIGVAQPITNPNPAAFIIFGGIGVPQAVDAFPTPFGTLCFPPALLAPFAGLFVVANSFSPAAPALVPFATLAPWSATNPIGIPVTFTMTVQGLIVHNNGVANQLAITNGVILDVR